MHEPFRIDLPETVLDDLAARLEHARPPSPPILDGGESAETIKRIEELVAYWRSGYDWRAQERRLNAFPQFRAPVDGGGVHFLHVRGTGPNPPPLLLPNGWPTSVVEDLAALGPRAAPAADRGGPLDS